MFQPEIQWRMREDTTLWHRVAQISTRSAACISNEGDDIADTWARKALAEKVLADPLTHSRPSLAQVAANAEASKAAIEATGTADVIATDGVTDDTLERIINATWTDVAKQQMTTAHPSR